MLEEHRDRENEGADAEAAADHHVGSPGCPTTASARRLAIAPWAEPGRPGNAFDRLMAKVDAADAVVEGHAAVLRDLLFQKTGERLEL